MFAQSLVATYKSNISKTIHFIICRVCLAFFVVVFFDRHQQTPQRCIVKTVLRNAETYQGTKYIQTKSFLKKQYMEMLYWGKSKYKASIQLEDLYDCK